MASKADFLGVDIDARDLQRTLRAFVPDVEKRTRKAMRGIAREVRDDARGPVPRGPARGGHATAAIRSGADGIVPYVSRGSPRYPYIEWLDHGGQRPRDTESRPFSKEGRYFFPAVARSRKRVQRRADDVIDKATRAFRLV